MKVTDANFLTLSPRGKHEGGVLYPRDKTTRMMHCFPSPPFDRPRPPPPLPHVLN